MKILLAILIATAGLFALAPTPAEAGGCYTPRPYYGQHYNYRPAPRYYAPPRHYYHRPSYSYGGHYRHYSPYRCR